MSNFGPRYICMQRRVVMFFQDALGSEGFRTALHLSLLAEIILCWTPRPFLEGGA